MANAGRVAIVPKGDWDSSEAYKRLDAVTYNNILYIAKKVVPKNTAVTNTDYWMLSVAGGVAVKATTKNIGQVQPDGETIEVDADGKISAKTALDTKPTIIATAEPNIVDTVEASMLVTNATKNLLKPILETTTKGGVTCTKNSDGTYTLNGTANKKSNFYVNVESEIIQQFVGKKLRIVGSPVGASGSTYGVTAYIISKSGKTIYHNDYGDGKTFVVTDNMKNIKLYIEIYEGQTVDDVIFKPMLTTDLSATYDDFVPYDGYEIKSCGKNLLDPNAVGTYDSPHSENGVTFTKNNDGSWTINGTATANVGVSIGYPGGDHTLIELEADAKAFLYGPSGLSGVSYGFYSNEGKQVLNDGIIPKGTKVRNLWISADIGNTLNNIKVFGVISYDLNLADTMYVPYKESTVQITPSTEFPLLGLKSFDGETNIISPGNVEVAFAKSDSGKAILGMCKPTVKNLVSTVEGNPLDATMGAQLKKEIDELKAKVDAMSTSTTTE